jgi:hypothetical protein
MFHLILIASILLLLVWTRCIKLFCGCFKHAESLVLNPAACLSRVCLDERNFTEQMPRVGTQVRVAVARRTFDENQEVGGICPLVIVTSQWPLRLRRRSAAERLQGSWVRIPPGAWMFVLYSDCVVRYRSLRRADPSSRGVLPTVVCVWVWSNETKQPRHLLWTGT